MSLPREAESDHQLVRYLLGLLPDEESERLDELSIADDTVAWRLRVVEDDLVDSYVRGSLEGESLEHFESFYLASPIRREKVNFAGSFLHTIARPLAPGIGSPNRGPVSPPAAPVAPADDTRSSGPTVAPSSKRTQEPRPQPRLRLNLNWTLLAVAAVVVLAFGTVLIQEVRLRTGLARAESQTAALEQRAGQLEQQLRDQRQAIDDASRNAARASAPPPVPVPAPAAPAVEAARPESSSRRLPPTALLLLPQTRAAGPVATVAVPRGTDRVPFRLLLESNDFTGYQVEMKDPANNRTLWRTGRLTATAGTDGAEVRVSIPATSLKPSHYSFELAGLDAAGKGDVISSYIVQVVP